MPTGMAMSRVSTSETTFMPTVRGRRSRILVSTGRESADMELPKSSCTMRVSQSQYCTYSGRSRPYSASSRWRAAAPASGLSVVSRSVGEPGARWMTQKLIMVMPHSTSSIHSVLRKTCRSGPERRLFAAGWGRVLMKKAYSVRVIHWRMSSTSFCQPEERRSLRKRAYRESSRPVHTSIR